VYSRKSSLSTAWRGCLAQAESACLSQAFAFELAAVGVVHDFTQDSVCRMRVIRSNYYRGRRGIVRLVETGRRRRLEAKGAEWTIHGKRYGAE
jgi:hypothetical protein